MAAAITLHWQVLRKKKSITYTIWVTTFTKQLHLPNFRTIPYVSFPPFRAATRKFRSMLMTIAISTKSSEAISTNRLCMSVSLIASFCTTAQLRVQFRFEEVPDGFLFFFAPLETLVLRREQSGS